MVTDPNPLVPSLRGRREDVARVDVVVVASAIGVALEQQGGLVDAVNDAITRNIIRCLRNACKVE